MAKEKVIIFQGEDKFITPRAHTFDLGTGKKEFVGGDGTGPSNDPSTNIPPPSNTPQGPDTPVGNVGGGSVVGMPTLGEPDYCNKLQTYITTRGGGNASPNEIMAAHDMFKRNCMEADPTTTTTTAAPPPPPKPDVVVPVIPVANLGVPPLSMGGGGGGGAEEGAPAAPKKKNYWWLLLVVAGIYLVSKKKK
jgi:hypothetical protein